MPQCSHEPHGTHHPQRPGLGLRQLGALPTDVGTRRPQAARIGITLENSMQSAVIGQELDDQFEDIRGMVDIGKLDFLRVTPEPLASKSSPPFFIPQAQFTTSPGKTFHPPKRNPAWPWLAALGIVAAFVSAAALSAEQSNPPSNWLHLGAISYHFNRAADYNEINHGLGIEHQFNARHSLSAGAYRNSERRTTVYALYGYTPLQIGIVKLGLLAGLANGYSANNGNVFPVALPVAMIERGRFGFNFTVIPSIREKVDGGVAMQFKLKL